MVKCALEDLSSRVQGYFYEFDNIHQEDDIHKTSLVSELSSNTVKLQVLFICKLLNSFFRLPRTGSLTNGELLIHLNYPVLKLNDLFQKKKHWHMRS